MARKRQTLYIFPEFGSMGIVRLTVPDDETSPPFGSIEITCGSEDSHAFATMSKFFRRSRAITISHAPNLIQGDNPNLTHIVIACHETKAAIEKGAEPLMIIIINVDISEHVHTIQEFDTRVFTDGFFVLSVTLGNTTSYHFIIEVFALAPKIQQDGFEAQLSIFVGEPHHYAEYSPPLADPHEGLAVALRNYRASNEKSYHSDSVNLTGLIPDGRA